MLPGLTEVARYRANELITNFSHTSSRDACNELKYGEFVDMTLYGLTAEDSYYQGYNREAIGMGDWFGTAESMSDRIADGFHHSKGHWSYVGSSKYPYIAVGVTKANGKWVCLHLYERRKLRRITGNSYVFSTISYVFLRFSYVLAFVAICLVRIRVGIDKRISIRLYGIPRQSAQESLSYSRVHSEN